VANPYIIGFTGTRGGMTEAQLCSVHQMFMQCVATAAVRQHDSVVLLHGDCVGADAQMHALCRLNHPQVKIEGYRVGTGSNVANCEFDVLHDSTDIGHLARNREIVARCNVLLGAPPCVEVQMRGGTWYTIKAGWAFPKVTLAFGPSGEIINNPNSRSHKCSVYTIYRSSAYV
jgi:hypothetical protein